MVVSLMAWQTVLHELLEMFVYGVTWSGVRWGSGQGQQRVEAELSFNIDAQAI